MPEQKICQPLQGTYGLVGTSLSHSFSPQFFAKKGLRYLRFEIKRIEEIEKVLTRNKTLCGINITFPYKEKILAYAQAQSQEVRTIGAANVLKKIRDGYWKAYNTDYWGFLDTMKILPKGVWQQRPALILGTGGAAKAVHAALTHQKYKVAWVSRRALDDHALTYQMLQSRPNLLKNYGLIVHATPVGTFPKVHSCVPLPYEGLDQTHMLYDLVYNPRSTEFLRRGQQKAARTQHGYEMLIAQAKWSLKIWASDEI